MPCATTQMNLESIVLSGISCKHHLFITTPLLKGQKREEQIVQNQFHSVPQNSSSLGGSYLDT
jgi:hypothetical protein